MRQIVGVLLLAFVVNGFGSFGQSVSRTYGDIAPSDFVSTQNEASAKSQGAIVLFDVGESYFVQSGYSFNLVLERHIRIKILNNVGLKWANEQIPYYASGSQTEVVKGLTAVTYNLEEGDIVSSEFDSTQTFVEKLTNTWYLKKFALPAVRPGSIIEYKYKVVSPFKFNLHDWEFQTEIPTLHSSYQVRLIPFYEYVYILKGPDSTIKPDTTYEKKRSVTFNGIDYSEKVYKFSMMTTRSSSTFSFQQSTEPMAQLRKFFQHGRTSWKSSLTIRTSGNMPMQVECTYMTCANLGLMR